MIFNLEKGLLLSHGSPFFMDLAGNFSNVYAVSFNEQLSILPPVNKETFLLPLTVQFRPLPDGSVWLDWTESEKGSENWTERFVLTLLDRSFQTANEICRRSNDFEVQILSADSVHPGWIELISDRMNSDYSLKVI